MARRSDDDPVNPVSFTAHEATGVLNEAQELASLLTLCFETTADFTLTPGATFYALRAQLPDFLAPLRIMGPAGRIRPATLADLDAENTDWQASPGTPRRYCSIGFGFLVVTPQPTETTILRITYARAPLLLANDDSFPEMLEEYHQDLGDFGSYRIKLKEGAQSLSRAMEYLNRYLDRMTDLGEFVRSKSRAAQHDTLPFELKSFDRSTLAASLAKGKKKQWSPVTA